MVKTKWDLEKLMDAVEREAGRIHDSATFLTPIERETYTRVFEMFALLIQDRQLDRLPAPGESELQRLRDWMGEVGAWREDLLSDQRLRSHVVMPSFHHRTAEELRCAGGEGGKVVQLRPDESN